MNRLLSLTAFGLTMGLISAPLAATCIVLVVKPVAKARITLKMVGGRKSLIRITRNDGKLMLGGLRSGAWTAQIGATGNAFPLNVGNDGRLTLIAESSKSECHAPPIAGMPDVPPNPPSVNVAIRQL